MRTVKLSRPLFHVDTHYRPGESLVLPDDLANMVVKDGGGEFAKDSDLRQVANADANPLHDVLDPLVADADPLHSARALGARVEEHPGLVAIKSHVTTASDAAEPVEKAGRTRPNHVVKPEVLGRPEAESKARDEPSPAARSLPADARVGDGAKGK